MLLASVDSVINVPAAAHARAVATSPSGFAIRCSAVGAASTGILTGCPSTIVERSTFDTSTSTRGTSATRSNAKRFSRSVHSSPAPPA